MTTAIEIEDVSFAYGERAALRNVDLAVPAGSLYAFLGPNGSGKTTLFRILATLLPAHSGEVRLHGDVLRARNHQLRRQLGVVFQTSSLDDKLTVAENLQHHGWLYGCRGRALRTRIDQLLQRLQLSERAAERVETLSGGLRRRVELARCLVHEPRVVLLDEPTTGLDPKARNEFWQLLGEVRESDGVTVAFTTHWFEEADAAGRLAILDAGELVAEGTPHDLRKAVTRDVVTVQSPDPDRLAGELQAALQTDILRVQQSLRIEADDSAAVVALLLERFADEITSVTASHATLEDVFIHQTGKQFVVGAT